MCHDQKRSAMHNKQKVRQIVAMSKLEKPRICSLTDKGERIHLMRCSKIVLVIANL
jgi:hypothetical protein